MPSLGFVRNQEIPEHVVQTGGQLDFLTHFLGLVKKAKLCQLMFVTAGDSKVFPLPGACPYLSLSQWA